MNNKKLKANFVRPSEKLPFQQEILSKCLWSEPFNSVKKILKRTANQLPLVVLFTDDSQSTTNDRNAQTIFFFDRNLSRKTFLTPLQQQFDTSPTHQCILAITDAYKGLFEFLQHGQRCCLVFSTLEQLTQFASTQNNAVVFMSRDRAVAFYQDPTTFIWRKKKYPQGSIFQAQRIHRSPELSSRGEQINNDFLECLDEEGYRIFLKMDQTGRFSLIAVSNEQQENQAEIYLHSTQSSNVDQMVQRIFSSTSNCIRLVRGPAPKSFTCQYFQYIHQETIDTLVGLTEDNLIIEWNIESQANCRYATNLNELLKNLFQTNFERTLDIAIDQARIYHREQFQCHLQLLSSQDWNGFIQYWKWTGEIRSKTDKENSTNPRGYHLIASIQDLSDHSRSLISKAKKFRVFYPKTTTKPIDNQQTDERRNRQHSFFTEMSRLLSKSSNEKNPQSSRISRRYPTTSGLVLSNQVQPFDNSIYESNQRHRFSVK